MRDTPARMPRASLTTELVTVLFTDIVSSTEIASGVGDKRWRALVAAHHGLVRRSLKRYHGRVLDTAGDGFFASFARPADAIRRAVEVAEGVRQFGLEIRAGLHLGEAEIMGGKVGGHAVNTGARIMGLGTAGEVLVSSTVRDSVAGKGIGFADHGVHQLKGIGGEHHVSVVTTLDDRTLEPPLDPSETLRRRQLPPPVPRSRPRRVSLYGWWTEVAGPADTGVFSPKDEPIDVPEGRFTLDISPGEAGPANEGKADERWIGEWVIESGDRTFREHFVGVYDEMSGLLSGKANRVILVRSYEGDTLILSDTSPERPCQAFRDLASYKAWQRVG